MKVVHISDFHLRLHLPGTSAVPRRLSRETPALLRRAVAEIQAEGPDLVAVTGDLVDHPFDDMDGAENLRLGRLDLEEVRRAFEPLACPVAFLGGNHDHPLLLADVFAGGSADFEVQGHRVLCFADAEGPDNVPRREGGEARRFAAALEDADRRPQIHLQHYLIAPRRDEGYPHTYAGAEDMAARIEAAAKVRLVLSGHYHPGVEPFERAGTWYGVAPAFCEEPHPFRVYTLDGGTVGWREVRLS